MDARIETDFTIWLRRMGYHGKQVREAARQIGIDGATVASKVSSGVRELTATERLAMSAVRAGLKPWTPSYDRKIVRQDGGSVSSAEMKAEADRLREIAAELTSAADRLSQE